MSNKMLMEDWRKFLVESTSTQDYFDAMKAAQERGERGEEISVAPKTVPRLAPDGPSYPNTSDCVTVYNLIRSIELAQKSYEVSDIRDERWAYVKQMAGEAGMDVALALAIASAGIASGGTALVLGLIPTFLRGAKHLFYGEPPPSTVKGIEAFVDHINIAQPYRIKSFLRFGWSNVGFVAWNSHNFPFITLSECKKEYEPYCGFSSHDKRRIIF